MGKKLIHSLQMAFSTYSRLPVGTGDWPPEDISYAMCFFPWIGVVIGIFMTLLYALKQGIAGGNLPETTLLFAVLFTLLPFLITGGIHMDGFVDTQDALHAYRDREQRLAILKDPHIGAFGVLSMGMVLLALAGLFSCVTETSFPVILLGYPLSRTLSGLSVLTFPLSRPEGMLFSIRQGAAKSCRVVLGLYLVILGIGMVGLSGFRGGAALVSAGCLFAYYHHMAKTKFGGITGDLAGYFLVICELGVAAAAVGVDLLLRLI